MDDGLAAQFSDITGATPQLAQQYLTLNDGNLEQAIQLFFESGGVDLTAALPGHASSTAAAAASGTAGAAAGSGAGRQADDAIRLDSDDEAEGDAAAAAAAGGPTHSIEDDEAMARRMQQEMYGDGGGASGGPLDPDIDPETGVRRPMARTAETLAAPSAYGYADDDDIDEAVRAQLLARQRRNGQRPGIFNQAPPPTGSVWDDDDGADGDGAASSADPDARRRRLARATGGASEATSKSTRLAEMYRPPFDIISPLVSWEGIRAQGKELEKWILLNVQDPNIFDCQVLNRDVWKHPEVKETVRASFIFKQYAKTDPQAQSYLRYYFPDSESQDAYPHIAIVDPRTGEQVKVWSGPPVVAATDFLSQLHEFLDRYSLKAHARNPVATRKPERRRVEVERMTEEEMLEMAMQNSLGGGGGPGAAAERRQSGAHAEDPDVLTRPDAGSQQRSAPTAQAAGDDAAAAASTQNGDGPSRDSPFAAISATSPHTEPDASTPDTTRIQFRHPGGRVVRRFGLQEPVRRIFEWLKASPLDDAEGRAFELVFMGKNLLDVVDSTIDAAGLKNGSVMVEFVEE